MKKLDELLKMIEVDSIIDKDNLDGESLKIPMLHSRYYSMLIEELRNLKIIESAFNILVKDKTDYYLGKSPDSVYRENPLFHKVLKNELELYLKADKELIKMDQQKSDQRIKIDLLEAFIKTINNRSFNISNAISFIKFKNGVN